MARKAIPQSVRFAVFKRDEFTCQYCGRHPPAVILEIDHVTPVAEGGCDFEDNLLTACFDCNRGKGARPLSVVPLSVAEKSAIIKEREEQIAEYHKVLVARRQREDRSIDAVISFYEDAFEGWTLTDPCRESVRYFLNNLSSFEVAGAMDLSCSKMPQDSAWRYFCGICHNKIRENRR